MNPSTSILFLIVCAMMGSYLYFALHVAPFALCRWAEEHGYQVIQRQRAGPLDWWSFSKGSGHHIYRVVILDEAGETRRGLARVGNPNWICLSTSRCPVEIRWDSQVADHHDGFSG